MIDYKGYLIFFGGLYWFVFIVYKILLSRKIKKNKEAEITEFSYLIPKFNLDKKQIKYARTTTEIALINAFIISFVATIISSIPVGLVYQLLIGFVMIFALIYSLYEIYGRHLAKKWGNKK